MSPWTKGEFACIGQALYAHHASANQEFHQKSRKEVIQVGQMGTQLFVALLQPWSDEGKEKDNISEKVVAWIFG